MSEAKDQTDADAASFWLNVRFIDLALFVPAPNAERLHALLPNFSEDGTVEKRHLPRLVYNAEYDSKYTGSLPRLCCIDLTAKDLRFDSSLGSAGGSVVPGDEIANLQRPEFGSAPPVERKWVLPNPDANKIHARVFMPPGDLQPGRRHPYRRTPGGGGPVMQLSSMLTWRVRVMGSTLGTSQWKIDTFAGTATNLAKELRPLQNAIDLYVFNAPIDELPPITTHLPSNVKDGTRAAHFRGLWNVYPPSVAKAELYLAAPFQPVSIPEFREIESFCKPHKPSGGGSAGFMPSAIDTPEVVTCIGGQARLAE